MKIDLGKPAKFLRDLAAAIESSEASCEQFDVRLDAGKYEITMGGQLAPPLRDAEPSQAQVFFCPRCLKEGQIRSATTANGICTECVSKFSATASPGPNFAADAVNSNAAMASMADLIEQRILRTLRRNGFKICA